MRYQLQTKSITNTQHIDRLIKKELLPKINQSMLDFSRLKPLLTIHCQKHSRWGYQATADLTLPHVYRIHADAHAKTIRQTLINLRNKIGSQLADYRDQVISH